MPLITFIDYYIPPLNRCPWYFLPSSFLPATKTSLSFGYFVYALPYRIEMLMENFLEHLIIGDGFFLG
jgi:hypothetical protein